MEHLFVPLVFIAIAVIFYFAISPPINLSRKPKRYIMYFDYAGNRVWTVLIDEEILHNEYEGSVQEYAEAIAPSNNYEWMLIDENTKFIK